MFFRLLLLIFLSFLPGAAQAGIQASSAVTHYHLEVSFDLPKAKILGVAKIQGAPGRKLVIHLGELQVKSLRRRRPPPGSRSAMASGSRENTAGVWACRFGGISWP